MSVPETGPPVAATHPDTATNPDTAPATHPDTRPPPRRRLMALGLALIVAVVAVELLATFLLRPTRQADRQSAVQGVGGVASMIRGVPVDPGEEAQVAREQRQLTPLAFLSLGLLDGLLLVGAATIAAPQWRAARGPARPSRLNAFLPSLAVLLAAVALAVVAISRLRFLSALYLSPPYGTLSYLLLYGGFRRGAVLAALGAVLVIKLASAALLARSGARSLLRRGMAGLLVTSVGAVVVAGFSFALTSSVAAPLADAFAAAVVAVAAILWAAVIVSASVRRLG